MRKKPKIIRAKLKDKTINDNWTLFETRKEERKKNKHNGRINKDRIIRDIKTLFETEKRKRRTKEKEAK